MRYFIEISYLGTAYHGWQVQKNAITVQQTINEALSTILRGETACMGSGRTDAGVHAIHQIAHFDTDSSLDPNEIMYRVNGLLDTDISINKIIAVRPDANARFDADSRSYIYKIHRVKNPFLYQRSHHFNRDLDIDKMNEACELFKKHKNFQAFSRVNTDVNNFDCEIFEIHFREEYPNIQFYIKANRFLRGMVRAIVATMIDIGEHKIGLKDLEKILESRDRRKAGGAAPPYGLYLNEILYPEDIYIK